jgi:hypothetical protein
MTADQHCPINQSRYGVRAAANRQIGDQFPVDLLSVFRRAALFGMD